MPDLGSGAWPSSQMKRFDVLRLADRALVVRYLTVRWRLHETYEQSSLLQLLNVERSSGAVVGLPNALASVRVAEAVVRRLTYWPDTCLFRALARFVVLRGAGHDVTFNMGVDIEPASSLHGHAWVTLGGCVLLERPPVHLTTTFTHPSAGDGRFGAVS